MPSDIRPAVHRVKCYIVFFVKWTALALAIGLACGAVGAAFHHGVDWAGALFRRHVWLLCLLPLAGLSIVGLYHAAGIRKDHGTNLVLRSLQSGEPVSFRVAPLIFLGTILTHLCGGSAGREGAALQIGAGLAACLNRLLHLEGKQARVVTMCGMSGLFAAVFGTPMTAAVFSMEVGTVGILHYTAFYPCLFSSFAAWEVSRFLGCPGVSFPPVSPPGATVPEALRVVALTLLCALCSILFLTVMKKTEGLYHRLFASPYPRIVAGGCLVAALSLALGTRAYNGAGMEAVTAAVAGEAAPWAFLAKILFTALTIGAGYKGGEIIPTFFIGATFGCTVGPLLGLEPGFAAAVGLVALFCCVVNCPMASVILAVELFGGQSLFLFALACALSYLMSGYYTLYAQQRFAHSKIGEEQEETAGGVQK